MPITDERLRGVVAWAVIVLIGVPVAGAVLLGVAHGDSPCILCWAQRTSMVLIALVGLFVLRFGPRPRYIGMAVLLGGWGVFMALRHSALHLARDVGQGFSAPILGLHTYTWSGIIHFTVLALTGILLLTLRAAPAESEVREPAPAGRWAMRLFAVVVAANAVQAFVSTGPPPYFGQGDPVRFSLDPWHWVWSFEELQPPRLSLRGSWDIPQPDPSKADPDPAHGPLAHLGAITPSAWERLGAPLQGTLSGFARNPRSGQFLAVTDRYGVYLLDSTLTRVVQHVVLDRGFSVDLSRLTGAAVVGRDTLVALSTNKSYVVLRPDVHANAELEWRHFLETDGAVMELRRSRFATVRARQNYVLSLAYDPAADELITVAVPNPRHPDLVVSRYARDDFLLSSEFVPRLGVDLEPSGPNRGVSDYVVTGAAVADSLLYLVSQAYSTLLVVDLRSHVLRSAFVVPGMERPVGLAVRGPQLLVAQADGRIAVLERPRP